MKSAVNYLPPFHDAEDLLAQLDRNNQLLWGCKPQFWVFRGHSKDDYKLIPSALREDKKGATLGYTFDPKSIPQDNTKAQIWAEFRRIHEFYWSADEQGLKIDCDSDLFRTPGGAKRFEKIVKQKGWPMDDLLPLIALAQHYGVPTRLLDWTDNPYVAAYFACKEAAKRQKDRGTPDPPSLSIHIWALNLDWVIHRAFPASGKAKEKIAVYVVSAPRASNPNLHAQGGVFTTERLMKSEIKGTEPVLVHRLDVVVEDRWKELEEHTEEHTPVMARLTLPSSEAGKLLRLLHRVGISAATLFPGYQGVADSLAERELWDKKEKVSYWLWRDDTGMTS